MLKRSVRRVIGVFAVLSTVVLLVGCGRREEMFRVTSPDRRVDAVWVRDSGGGATVGFSYKLFIVPTGGQPKRGTERLVAEDVNNLKMMWREAKRLEISYDEARIFSFLNYWYDRDLDDYRYVVEIRLLPQKASQLANPRGG